MMLDMQVRDRVMQWQGLSAYDATQTLISDQTDALERLLHETWPQVLAAILGLRTSDAEFIFTPSQLALACFHQVDPILTKQWIQSKMQLSESSKLRKHEQQTGDQSGEDASVDLDPTSLVTQVVDPIAAHIAASKQAVDRNAVVDIDKRLKYCTNPEKDPNSAL